MKIKRILCAVLLVFAVGLAHAQLGKAPAGPDVNNLTEAQIKGMQVPEALYRLVEANEMLGLTEEAKRDGAVLGYNYPGDVWYARAYKLLTSKGAKPDVKPDPKGKKGPDAPDLKHRKGWFSHKKPSVS